MFDAVIRYMNDSIAVKQAAGGEDVEVPSWL